MLFMVVFLMQHSRNVFAYGNYLFKVFFVGRSAVCRCAGLPEQQGIQR